MHLDHGVRASQETAAFCCLLVLTRLQPKYQPMFRCADLEDLQSALLSQREKSTLRRSYVKPQQRQLEEEAEEGDNQDHALTDQSGGQGQLCLPSPCLPPSE